MLYSFVLINIFLLLFINFYLKKKNFLIHRKFNYKHKSNYKDKIPLSGGIYFITSFFIIFGLNDFINFKIFFFGFLFFILGTFSDLNLKIRPLDRLFLMFIFSIIILSSENLKINNVNIFFLDYFIKYELFSKIFFSCCFVILLNGSNFIDGTNGNASGYYILCLLSLYYQLSELNIVEIETNVFYLMIFSITIFFLFNLFEKNFLGDNGVYLISSVCGLLILLIYSKNSLNTIYVVNILLYPAFEVLISFLRKLFLKKSPFDPDKHHLHHLISTFLKKKFKKISNSNTCSSILILFMISIFYLFVNKDMAKSIYQLQCSIIFVTIYSLIYLYLFYFLRKEK